MGKMRAPPTTYEDLTQAIQEQYDGMSPAYQQVAVFITQNPNDIAMLSVNALADKCGLHASSFVRFAQQFGFTGFKALQAVFRDRLATAAPGFEARVRALTAELNARANKGVLGLLVDLVASDIASLEDLLTNTPEGGLDQAVSLLESADTIYLIGQLRSEPVVCLLRYVLTMLERRTVLLDPSGGLATHIADVMRPDDVLVAVSFRFYATEVVNITQGAAARKIPVVAISDSTLSPLAKSATVLFAVPEREYVFSRSLAAPMCLAQALMVGLAARLRKGDGSPPQIPVATKADRQRP